MRMARRYIRQTSGRKGVNNSYDIIVQKYGGTSIATSDRMRSVANRVAESAAIGKKIVVVVSAMGAETDRLSNMVARISENPDAAAMDLLLATGEQTSVAMLLLALKELGVEGEAFLSGRIGMITDDNHGCARIKAMFCDDIKRCLDDGHIAVVAGFQGISENGETTTIGRGGSDTTAVAIAAALGATSCEIYTDVDGVFTADPKITLDSHLLDKISYEEMMELSDAGAKVLHARSVELAAKFGVPISVKSSVSKMSGTSVISEDMICEGVVVSGITCNVDEAKISVRLVPEGVGVTSAIFSPIARAGIDVDLIVQTISEDGFTELSFTVPKPDLRKALMYTDAAARRVSAGKVSAAGDIAKISVVGLGMRGHSGIAHRIFDAMAREGIAIQMIGTSEIKVSMVINIKRADDAVKALHSEFCLKKTKLI